MRGPLVLPLKSALRLSINPPPLTFLPSYPIHISAQVTRILQLPQASAVTTTNPPSTCSSLTFTFLPFLSFSFQSSQAHQLHLEWVNLELFLVSQRTF